MSVDHGHLRYFDHGIPFDLTVQGSTLDPSTQERVRDADAAPRNERYTTQDDFKGHYRDAAF